MQSKARAKHCKATLKNNDAKHGNAMQSIESKAMQSNAKQSKA